MCQRDEFACGGCQVAVVLCLPSRHPPALPLPSCPKPQGDRLSLAGTSWTRMTNSWGSKWELS